MCIHVQMNVNMNTKRKSLIYKIAKAYYQSGLTQQEIANRFGISRIMVSRLLQKALTEKIVEFKIYPPEDLNVEIEHKLESKYNLKEAIVVSTFSNDYDEILETLGDAGVDYLQRTLQGEEIISVSWGKSLLALVNALPSINYNKMQIVQMIGGLGYPEEERSGTELVRRMGNAFGAQPRLLNSPGIVKTIELSTALKKEPQISAVLELAKKAQIALVGIGHFTDESILCRSKGILSKKDIQFLKQNGAVGDISLRFFNKNGELINGDLNNRVVGLEMPDIQAIDRVVAIAGGTQKAETIRAALKGGYINVLITNNDTAKKLIN